MNPGLVAALAAAAALATAAGLVVPVRRALYGRRLRLRLDLQPGLRAGWPGPGILGLTCLPDSELAPPRADCGTAVDTQIPPCQIEPPQFWIRERRPALMAPALLASAALHATVLACMPGAFVWLSRAFDREAILVVRVDGVIRMPLTLQAPDMRRVLFAREHPAAPGGSGLRRPKAASAVRHTELVEPAIPGPSRSTRELPAPPVPSAAAEIATPRPERPYRVVPATTLLQPRRPVAQKELVELPAFAAWAGKMPEIPLVQTPGSPLAGMAQAAPPSRAPVLPLRSGAPVRAEPPRLEEPKLALPPPGIPAETPPVAGAMSGSGIPQPGDPVSVLSISPVPLKPGEAVTIPPVNQVGGGLGTAGRAQAETGRTGTEIAAAARLAAGSGVSDAGGGPAGTRASGSGSAGTGTAAGGREGAPGGTGTARSGAGPGDSSTERPGAAAGPGGRGTGTSAPVAGGTAVTGSGTGSAGAGNAAAGVGRGPVGGAAGGTASAEPNGMVPIRLGSQTVLMERRPEGAVVLHYPADGSFDVIVVESALPDPLAGLAKRLSGRPVYTAYLNVGAEREWLLHFCAAEKPAQTPAHGMVVTLEDPPPLKPPFVLRAELPAPEEWKSSQYQVFHGYISGQGKLERITAVRASRNPATLLKLLPYWEFRPATRGGAPVEVEVLLVIPPERMPSAP